MKLIEIYGQGAHTFAMGLMYCLRKDGIRAELIPYEKDWDQDKDRYMKKLEFNVISTFNARTSQEGYLIAPMGYESLNLPIPSIRLIFTSDYRPVESFKDLLECRDAESLTVVTESSSISDIANAAHFLFEKIAEVEAGILGENLNVGDKRVARRL